MTDHDSGAKDKAEEVETGRAAAPNVVPFPRSWYGSVDELVPIDPQPPRPDRATESVSDASAFWGGDSDPAPVADDEIGAASVKTSPPQQVVTERHDAEFDVAEPSPPRRQPAVARPRSRSPRRVPAAFALALIALLVGVISVAALGRGAAPSAAGTTGVARQPDLTVTQTVPQTTTVVQTVTTSSGATVRHRHRRRREPRQPEGARQAVATAPRQVAGAKQGPATTPPATTTPANTYHPSAPANTYHQSASPASSGSSSRGNNPPAGGATPPAAGSSKPSCAPSMTNGGACSL